MYLCFEGGGEDEKRWSCGFKPHSFACPYQRVYSNYDAFHFLYSVAFVLCHHHALISCAQQAMAVATSIPAFRHLKKKQGCNVQFLLHQIQLHRSIIHIWLDCGQMCFSNGLIVLPVQLHLKVQNIIITFKGETCQLWLLLIQGLPSLM